VRILRAADRVAAPWKNGGGVTREVAIWPPDSTFDNFDWRVSIAEVRAAGPFSVFENVDRVLLILEGRIALDFADGSVALDAQSAPIAFPGDAVCHGRPLDGIVLDLNVMTRRGRCSARMERLAVEPSHRTANHALVVATSPATLQIGTGSAALESFDALALNKNARVRLQSGAAVLISIVGP
jgi:environmental stress-induced protein Ves